MFKKIDSFVGRDYNDYFKQVRETYKNIDNPFWYYEKLLDDLANIDNVEILPLREFVKKSNSNKKRIGFRHDIDADPITAVKCARALAKRGLSGSFYFLHSAIYYGEFYNKVFIRNPEVQNWIKQIVIAGSEIGLHNDAIGITNRYKINGVKHLKDEINWLSSLGTNIYGTVAHNNFLVNGAENYEIFEELTLYKRKIFDKNRKIVSTTDMKELNLEYEGTFGIPKKNISIHNINKYKKLDIKNSNMDNKDWTYKYFFDNPVNDWSCETQIWLVGKNKWIIASKINEEVFFEFHIPLSKVIVFIKTLSLNKSILFVLHPEYFGGK